MGHYHLHHFAQQIKEGYQTAEESPSLLVFQGKSVNCIHSFSDGSVAFTATEMYSPAPECCCL